MQEIQKGDLQAAQLNHLYEITELVEDDRMDGSLFDAVHLLSIAGMG